MARILVVEDHADSAEAFSRLLKNHGYEVEVADTIEAARAAAAAQSFDLLLCDLTLPDGDGRKLLQEIRASKPVKGIALSGHGSPDDIRASLDAGFDDHLVKPADLAKITSAIAKVLGCSP
jgi:DNA-binding response OmpR family regulator